jgi:hypothetical protein
MQSVPVHIQVKKFTVITGIVTLKNFGEQEQQIAQTLFVQLKTNLSEINHIVKEERLKCESFQVKFDYNINRGYFFTRLSYHVTNAAISDYAFFGLRMLLVLIIEMAVHLNFSVFF